MRRIHYFCLTSVLLSSVAVQADLVVQDYLGNGQKVVLDNVSGYHWYWNLPDFTNKSYQDQIDAIADLGNYGGIDGGWRMATADDMAGLWAYTAPALATAFPKTGECTNPYWGLATYRRGRVESSNDPGNTHMVYGVTWIPTEWFKTIVSLHDSETPDSLSAWVVSPAPVVPEPTSVILAATGLLSSTLGLKRLRRKHQE